MKTFNRKFNTITTKVKFFGDANWYAVTSINDTRINITVDLLGGSFQRGHVQHYTNTNY